MAEYDTLVGRLGLHEASCQILRQRYISELCVHGQQNIPSDGPVLFLSNHPGMTDTVSLFAAIPHSNLRIIATHRPFLLSLPNISQHLSYISADSGDRLRAVRQVSSHLRSGGAALTFPAGKIEPDPDVHTGAEELVEALDRLFRRLHALRTGPADRPGAGQRRDLEAYRASLADAYQALREEREKLAAALQLLAMIVRDARPTTVNIWFGKPITRQEVDPEDTSCVHKTLMERMRCLLEQESKRQGVSKV